MYCSGAGLRSYLALSSTESASEKHTIMDVLVSKSSLVILSTSVRITAHPQTIFSLYERETNALPDKDLRYQPRVQHLILDALR